MEAFWVRAQEKMLREQIIARGINNEELLGVMKQVTRHFFVSENWRVQAYQDKALPIDCQQTISQPYIVALMTNELLCCNREKVLEVGTGCGYQTAILSKLFQSVFTLERIDYLYKKAQNKLQKLAFSNIRFYCKDGYQGLPEEAPFDAILVSCAAEQLPQNLCKQLAINGKMIIPLGKNWQELLVIQRLSKNRIEKKHLGAVSFVPMLSSTE